jgi:hypothetical protein
MLDAIGESPVNTLSGIRLSDAAEAVRKLDEVAAQVQNVGWHCNTEENVRLLPDSNGNVNLPTNTLRCDTTGASSAIDVVIRGTKLYNRADRTLVFTSATYVDLILELPFEELTFALKNYVLHRAGRIYQEGAESSIALDKFTKRNEDDAYAQLLDEEAENEDANLLRNNRSVGDVVARYYTPR